MDLNKGKFLKSLTISFAEKTWLYGDGKIKLLFEYTIKGVFVCLTKSVFYLNKPNYRGTTSPFGH